MKKGEESKIILAIKVLLLGAVALSILLIPMSLIMGFGLSSDLADISREVKRLKGEEYTYTSRLSEIKLVEKEIVKKPTEKLPSKKPQVKPNNIGGIKEFTKEAAWTYLQSYFKDDKEVVLGNYLESEYINGEKYYVGRIFSKELIEETGSGGMGNEILVSSSGHVYDRMELEEGVN